MTVQVEALLCGHVDMRLSGLLEGLEGRIRIPVNAYLIRHPKGIAVFDTGLHRSLVDDPVGNLEPLGSRVSLSAELREGEDLAARLMARGIDPGQVDWAINSHLHFDHCGGNALVPDATVVVQAREWQAANEDETGYPIRHDAIGQPRLEIEGEHDLFGDGSVTCVPTPGHTAGHQSVTVRAGGAEMILTADACYMCRTLEAMHMARTYQNRDAARNSLLWIQHRWQRGARVEVGHEPAAWDGHGDGFRLLFGAFS